MALSMQAVFSLNRSFCRRRILKHPQVRSQFKDDHQGKWANNNIVDANLRVLTERIKELRTKESLNKCMMLRNIGWNYKYNYGKKTKGSIGGLVAESLVFMGFASGVLGLVFLGGTLCICLVFLIVQLTAK
ncbi:hypothetical protein FEM48_Zijuj10G0131600 [Ziziphus jujuba var. spinosa]|uniref:Transmembrane protein n=1 Tax=Ziziphus jujuba var. spinosa TaxID=714518 RepID=A0A978UNK0_ZIZJJ|nr:hypothetical protein FEM48_Zijuj10G0131600 [Ziziphus jujuba var. spinosa]